MKKKILFVVPSLSQTNGVAAFLMNYIQNINLKDFEIMILTTHVRPSQHYLDILERLNIEVVMTPFLKRGEFFKYLKCLNDFFKKQGKFDLIYLNLVNQGIFILPIARKYGNNNFAMHSHATTSSESKFKKMFNDTVIKIIINKFNYLFSCSTEAGVALFKQRKFDVIRNAIDYEKFRFSNENRIKIREKMLISDDCKVVGFVGRFSKQKNVFVFIELAKRLSNNYKVLMIGTGDLKKEFIEICNKEKIVDKFIFIDECSDVYKYYSAMDLFVLPSLYEGLPVVAIEAQVNGIYTLLSDSISKETKITSNTYFFDRNNIDELYSLVLKSERKNKEFEIDDSYNIKIQAEEFQKLLADI